MSTSPTQAWAILNRHARDDIASLRLKELCTDNDRVSSLVAVHNGSETAAKRISTSSDATTGRGHGQGHGNNNGHAQQSSSRINRLLIADLSRQLMTTETLNHLLRLAVAVDVRGFIQTLAWGQNNRNEPFDKAGNNGNDNERQRHQNTSTSAGTGTGAQEENHFNFSHTVDLMADIHNQSQRYHHSNIHTNSRQNSNTHHIQLSPSRSVTSTALKKTRFSDKIPNDNLTSSDDQTISSYLQLNSPSSQYHKIPLNTSPSMHFALRAPSHCNLEMLNTHGDNVLDEIHQQWTRIQLISNSIRKGQMRGVNGHLLQNILVIGRGSAFSACKFTYNALKNDERGCAGLKEGISDRRRMNSFSQSGGGNGRSMRFLSRSDPVALHSSLADLNPEQTLVISIILNEDEQDLIHLTRVVKRWMHRGLESHAKRREIIWGKHVLFVTASEILHQTQTITKPECTFLIPQCAKTEAFTSMSAAGILPLSMAFGWDIVQEMLNGAHDLDSHFVETSPRNNLPILLALVDIWNDHFLPSVCKIKPCGGRIITPFMDSFTSYPEFVATIESQVCGRVPAGRTRNPYNSVAPSGIIIDGGVCGSLDRVSYQGGRTPPSELIIAMNSQIPHLEEGRSDFARLLFGSENEVDDLSNQDHLMCSFFAHADVMALGSTNARGRDGTSVAPGYGISPSPLATSSFDSSFPIITPDNDYAGGNHPSTLLLCSRCDAFACGQLIALAEHRAMVTARLWDIENPFAFTQSHGSVLRSKQEENVKEKLNLLYQRLDLLGHLDDDDDTELGEGPKLNFAVKTILGHYATNMHQQRNYYMR